MDLLSAAEEMGYTRYWASEHHSPVQSASPTLVTALAAGLTSRMRVGTAGVLLRLTSAMRVAQDFAALQLYFPGRIDLGVAGALAGEPHDRHYAPDVVVPDSPGYADRLRRLMELVRRGIDSGAGPVPIGPVSHDDGPASRPQLWLCGTGASSAALAGTLGLRFAFHHYLAANAARQSMPAETVAAYRAAFVPQGEGDAAYVAVAAYGCCAPTLAEAEAEWRGHFSGLEPPSPTFLGTPDACADALSALAGQYGADELVVDCFTASFSARLSALGLLAAAFR
jgi:luciferase family oxidoreductase group 1